MQCDDPDSLANNTKRPLNVNAPLFTPQSTMGNGGNILDQVRIVSNLFIWYQDKGQKIHVFFLGSISKKIYQKIVVISSQTSKMGQIEKENAHKIKHHIIY